jgi:hypothetical protein
MMDESQVVKDTCAKIQAHLDRADTMLSYIVDGELDKAIAILEALPTATLRARFEPFTCIFPLAPIDKIQACLAGGGLVCAIIGTKAQWIASAASIKNNVLIVQVVACNATEAKVIYYDGETDTLKDPAKKILAGCLFWVGA